MIWSEARLSARTGALRRRNEAFARWAAGFGVLRHTERCQNRVWELAQNLHARGLAASPDDVFTLLAHADRLASAAMWLVAHMTYATRVRRDGSPLQPGDFKAAPEGHTGGSLNMVPAYVGYLAADALTRTTRSWLMGQGHCVAAIQATNLLVGNQLPELEQRYDTGEQGLSRFCADFYSYAVRPDGRPESPLGSHVNPLTAGGLVEGGYLGFAELLWVHMPLPGERLAVFLSDGAFEEQRGSDWAPRWWRAEDSGLVAPVMIANGRRIDQRTTLAQQGGVDWLRRHLRLNGFDPFDVDGRDPAELAWALLECEERLSERGEAVAAGRAGYPVPMPYAIAETIKGFGFPGAGTNRAHNLPLAGNPAVDAGARDEFNAGARALWVPPEELDRAVAALTAGVGRERPPAREHPLAVRDVPEPDFPEPPWRPADGEPCSPMEGLDESFVGIVRRNPSLRPRVGNPDELRSNRMNGTLDLLKHRVTAPEPHVAEAIDGGVITALNEEAVVCAALGNKGGLNLVVTYEAFGVKMLGALRQEIIFARHQAEVGRPARWLSVPVVLTSHTWENGKNEQSHQDPALCEALMGEMGDRSRVLFPPDWNSAVACLHGCYRDRGSIWTLVVPKSRLPSRLSAEQAGQLLAEGALALHADADPRVLLVALGGLQLVQARRASARLAERGIAHALLVLLEPGRFRVPRDDHEAATLLPADRRDELFPRSAPIRIVLAHTRPEPLLGTLRPLDTGPASTHVLGYRNRGGTLDTFGMLYANRCTWAHALLALAAAAGLPPEDLLAPAELEAATGRGDPRVLG